MGLSLIPRALVVLFIRIYKWFELKVLQLFYPLTERFARGKLAEIGVVCEFEDETGQELLSKRLIEEERVAKKSGYEKVIKLRIRNKRQFFPRVTNHISMGMGETYMERVWDLDDEDLTEFFSRALKSRIFLTYFNPWNRLLNYLEVIYFNGQTRANSKKLAAIHYDLGNDLYKSFLDPWLIYSCGYWARADNLNDAQVHKMELIGEKLKLKPGMRVLDIGCGWGGLCKFLAEKYSVECVGITISKEGAKYAQESCKGLPVEFKLMDYRDLDEKFDRIVSLEMIEHVGLNNYPKYFKVAHRCLKEDGLFLLQTNGLNHPEMTRCEPWVHTYLWPNGCLPYATDITKYTDGLFIIEDWHNFGIDYTPTLLAWADKFKKNWPKISDKYDDRFYRMWKYYLYSCSAGFQSRMAQVWQVVLSKDGFDGYRAVR